MRVPIYLDEFDSSGVHELTCDTDGHIRGKDRDVERQVMYRSSTTGEAPADVEFEIHAAKVSLR